MMLLATSAAAPSFKVLAFAFANWYEQITDPIIGKLVLQFLMPLFAQVGRNNDQDAAATLGPALRDDETGLDGFAEPNFIGQDNTTRKRVLASKQCVDSYKPRMTIQLRRQRAVRQMATLNAGSPAEIPHDRLRDSCQRQKYSSFYSPISRLSPEQVCSYSRCPQTCDA